MVNEKLASRKAWYAAIAERGANCDYEGAWKQFSGEVLPRDEEAEVLCRGCPAKPECKRYRLSGEPTYGVYADVAVNRFGVSQDD